MTDGERIFAVNMVDSWTVMTNITQVSMTLLNQRTIDLEVKEIHVGFNFISLYMYVIQIFFFCINVVNIYIQDMFGEWFFYFQMVSKTYEKFLSLQYMTLLGTGIFVYV